MVLRLKPMGKLTIFDNYLSVRQNQGPAWSSDSNLWAKDKTKVLHGPQIQTYGETNNF